VEGTSFFSGSKPKGSKLVKNVVEHNKIVTSDVDITVFGCESQDQKEQC